RVAARQPARRKCLFQPVGVLGEAGVPVVRVGLLAELAADRNLGEDQLDDEVRLAREAGVGAEEGFRLARLTRAQALPQLFASLAAKLAGSAATGALGSFSMVSVEQGQPSLGVGQDISQLSDAITPRCSGWIGRG